MYLRFSLPVVAAVALLAAGCGGGRAPGVARIASSTSTEAATRPGLVAYAHCMRTNGVPTFPDPAAGGGITKRLVVAAAQRNQNAFNAASSTCSSLLPNGGLAAPETPQQQRTRLADGLSFARCMRNHGLSRFPDPNAQGELTVEMVQAQGIDVHSPAVLRIVQACLPASHGALTMQKVAEALRNAGG